MHKRFLLLSTMLAASASAQTRSLAFSDPSGLAAEAHITLQAGGTQLEIKLRNRTLTVPAGFDESDQILTGLSFDLGDPGENANDPKIVSGTCKTGPSSASVNFDITNVGANADVGGEWGFGNGGTTNFYPNLISGNMSGTTAFGGANLDGPTVLDGPQGGLISVVHLTLNGLGAIQDEIVAVVDLDKAIADLDFLDNGARVEYGSDAAFIDECPTEAANAIVNDPLGFNLDNGLLPAPGEVPELGQVFTLQMDDPSNHCTITPGSLAFVLVNESPLISVLLANFGCAAGDPGNLMIDVFDPGTHFSGPKVWAGPGNPTTHNFFIGFTPATCGITCRGQGVFLDSSVPSRPIVLTNAFEFLLGT